MHITRYVSSFEGGYDGCAPKKLLPGRSVPAEKEAILIMSSHDGEEEDEEEQEEGNSAMEEDLMAELRSNAACSNVSQIGSTSYMDDVEDVDQMKEAIDDMDEEDDDDEEGEEDDEEDDEEELTEAVDEDENEDEKEMIAEMSQLTGLPWDECRGFLEMSDWDLSRAAELFYSDQQHSEEDMYQEEEEAEEEADAVTENSGVDSEDEERLNSPGVMRKALAAIRRFFSAEIGRTGRDAASKFVNDFELRYNTGPSFCVDSYKNAARLALSRGKALLVVLKSAFHQDTDEFCVKVLGSRRLNQYLNQHFVVWGADVSGVDGYFLMDALGVARLPFLAVLVCRPNAEELVERIQGILDPLEIQNMLDRATRRHRRRLESSRLEDEARQRDRQLRQEQDQEFQASLEADRAKARAAREAQEASIRKEEEAKQLELRAQAEKYEIQRRKEVEINDARLRLGDPPAPGEPTARLRLQLPNGAKVDRKFLPTQTLAHLRDFVQLHVHDNELDLHSFALATNYPRRVFDHEDDLDIPLSELSGKVIYVQDLDA